MSCSSSTHPIGDTQMSGVEANTGVGGDHSHRSRSRRGRLTRRGRGLPPRRRPRVGSSAHQPLEEHDDRRRDHGEREVEALGQRAIFTLASSTGKDR